MMDELKEVKRVLNPTEVLLVVDAMTGQEAAGSHTFILHFECQIVWLVNMSSCITIDYFSLLYDTYKRFLEHTGCSKC